MVDFIAKWLNLPWSPLSYSVEQGQIAVQINGADRYKMCIRGDRSSNEDVYTK